MEIRDKHIVITGGASGIGLELVRQLYEHNNITVIARPSIGLKNLRSNFENITIYEADFSDLKSVEGAADLIVKSELEIDVLINNAAVQYTPYFTSEDFRYETIKREIDINFSSVCTLIYLLMPNLLHSNPSMILNINSGLSLAPKTSSAVYCATKAALNVLSQSLAYQLEETNIEVKQAFLPLVDTAMTQGRGKGKLSVEKAVAEIIKGMNKSSAEINLGKVKALRLVKRISPKLANKIMKAA